MADEKLDALTLIPNATVATDLIYVVRGNVDYRADIANVVVTPTAHATSHQNGGADEISVAGLSGELADPQPPKNHDHASNKLAQSNTHESPDTDTAPTALHHTLGTGANQAAAGNHTHDGAYVPVSRKETIWVPAAAMTPATTNGAVAASVELATNKQMLVTLDFEGGADKYAQFAVAMPKSWDEGTVTAQFVWAHPATTVNFGVAFGLQGVALSDDDAIDAAWGTEQLAVDTGGTTNDIYITPETAVITIAGTPAEGDVVWFRAFRDVSDAGDTMAVVAKLVGVKLYITLNAGTDA